MAGEHVDRLIRDYMRKTGEPDYRKAFRAVVTEPEGEVTDLALKGYREHGTAGEVAHVKALEEELRRAAGELLHQVVQPRRGESHTAYSARLRRAMTDRGLAGQYTGRPDGPADRASGMR